MNNKLLAKNATIIKKTKENELINCFRLSFKSKVQKDFEFLAGQFLMVGIPGFGDAPFTLSSDPKDSKKYFEICVRTSGELSEKLNTLKVGDEMYIRGPFGNGFPEVKQNLIVIGGGCGFIPLKSVLLENLRKNEIKIQAFIGCRNKNTIVFEKEFGNWQKRLDLNVILEESAYKGFSKDKGFVTELITKTQLFEDPLVFVCGPEVMYKFVAKELLTKKIKPGNIYFSLERRMYCGGGVCQHCAVGTKYVCKDGPVFNYSFLQTIEKYKM